MTPSQIISAEMQSAGKDPEESLRAISMAVKAGLGILLHENNSVLFLQRVGKGEVELHLFTTDQPFTLVRSLREFIKKIKASDTKKVYGADEPKQTLELLKKLGIHIEKSDKPKFKWMAKV